MVFAPSPMLSVTVESKGDLPDVHLHAGGQGFWLARMIAELGVEVTLCGTFGGETGEVLHTLIERASVAVHRVAAEPANAAEIHDRRGGESVTVAEMPATPLSRHVVDELFGAALVEGLTATVCVLGGPTAPDVLPPDVYRRLAADLVSNGKTVVADLSGEFLTAVLDGGISIIKASHEDLVADGQARSGEAADLADAIGRLHARGAGTVVVSRADLPALAMLDDEIVEVVSPRLEPVEVRGAGDSMTAGIAVAVARGQGLDSALRLGAAAGSLNVTRRGLGSGQRGDIERLAGQVFLRRFRPGEPTPQVATPDDLAARVGRL
jgi:1-phosphofructokinase